MARRIRDPETAAAVFVLVALAFIAAALLGGVFLGRATKSSTTVTVTVSARTTPTRIVDPKVAAGAHDFVSFACAQCHGLDGRGGVSPFVPALKNAKTLTNAQLEQIINHGLGESSNPTHPYMPVWGQVISTRQVDDLVAYIHAGLPKVPTAAPVIVPNGLGGVPNPQSPDKTIPALSGADFFTEFDTDAKIRDVIVTGSVLGRAPIVSMPHWGGIIPPDRLNALVAYIKTLKSNG